MEAELQGLLNILPKFVAPYIFGIFLYEWIVDRLKSAFGAI